MYLKLWGKWLKVFNFEMCICIIQLALILYFDYVHFRKMENYDIGFIEDAFTFESTETHRAIRIMAGYA